jgi:CheY-like chemotaxis protein
MTYAKSCLLIDDDHDDQLVFSLAIKELNKPVLCIHADNGFDAISKLETENEFIPDFIFLDLNLPGLSGIDCLSRIKENPKLSHIPIVIYSTSSREEDIVKTKKLGAVGFITKPYHLLDLTMKLQELFQLH